MQCDKCRRSAVIYQKYSGLHLCREHFIADFESKAKKAIRFSGGLPRQDHIAVAGCGDYKSIALMHFLAALTSGRRGIRLLAIITGDESSGKTSAWAEEVAASLTIRCITAGPGDYHDPGSQHGEAYASPGFCAGADSCIERIAEKEGVTRIACGTSLDDEALSVLTAFLRGEPGTIAHPEEVSCRLPRLFPFLHIPDREIALYARLISGKKSGHNNHKRDPYSEEIQNLIDKFSSRHPSAPHSLVNLGERLRSIGSRTGKKPRNARSTQENRQDA